MQVVFLCRWSLAQVRLYIVSKIIIQRLLYFYRVPGVTPQMVNVTKSVIYLDVKKVMKSSSRVHNHDVLMT